MIRATEPIPNPMLPDGDGDNAVDFLMTLLIIGASLS